MKESKENADTRRETLVARSISKFCRSGDLEIAALRGVDFALREGELVGLAERADHFPAQLLGGEKQRVAIARAIASAVGS